MTTNCAHYHLFQILLKINGPWVPRAYGITCILNTQMYTKVANYQNLLATNVPVGAYGQTDGQMDVQTDR